MKVVLGIFVVLFLSSVASAANVTGTCWVDRNGDGYQGMPGNEPGIAGVVVKVMFLAGGKKQWLNGTTDPQGNFSVATTFPCTVVIQWSPAAQFYGSGIYQVPGPWVPVKVPCRPMAKAPVLPAALSAIGETPVPDREAAATRGQCLSPGALAVAMRAPGSIQPWVGGQKTAMSCSGPVTVRQTSSNVFITTLPRSGGRMK